MTQPNQRKTPNTNPTAADPQWEVSEAVRAAYLEAAKADPAAHGFFLYEDGAGGFELRPNYDAELEAAALADYHRRAAS